MKPMILYVPIGESPSEGLTAISEKMEIEVLGAKQEFSANLVAYPNVLPKSIPVVKFPSNKKPILPNETTSESWISVRVGNDNFWAYLYRKNDQYLSKAYNTTGQMLISDGVQRLILNIECNTLTIDDLNEAFSDFKFELLKIVFEDSKVFIRSNNHIFSPVLSDEALLNINSFIDNLNNVSCNLKTRLCLKETHVPVHKAKPSLKGIKELITNPSSRKISSLVTALNYDTGENQYVLASALKLRQFLFSVLEIQRRWLENNNCSQCYEIGSSYIEQDLDFKHEYENQKLLDEAKVKRNINLTGIIHNQKVDKVIRKLDTIIKKLKHHGIRPLVSSFNPMVFAQNSIYANFKISSDKFFRGTLFSYADLIDRINERYTTFSITSLPNFYERWCLVQLINVLTNHFHYDVNDPGWRRNLVYSCVYNKYNICLNFVKTTKSHREEISLIYQGEFRINGKGLRPDFLIKTKSNTWVVDAKFRTHSNNENLLRLCLELARNKMYNLNNNAPVFLFHSAPFAGQETSSNRYNTWQRYCNYGSDKFGYLLGHIFLSPRRNNKKQCVDNIIRWLLLILQDANWPTCPNCGDRLVFGKTRGKGISYQCESCNFYSIKTHCFKCGSPIWKNRWYWSYNLHGQSWTDVLCPYCGSHFTTTKTNKL